MTDKLVAAVVVAQCAGLLAVIGWTLWHDRRR